eukprot:3933969-Rhodomonas_salina.1
MASARGDSLASPLFSLALALFHPPHLPSPPSPSSEPTIVTSGPRGDDAPCCVDAIERAAWLSEACGEREEVDTAWPMDATGEAVSGT